MAMSSMIRNIRSFTGALAASLLVLTPVWADDTEIFFADTGTDNIWPNVLFIIDTSGSMNNTVYNPDGTSTGKDRLEHVQDAFRQLLTEVSNVNVGLMRFSNPGGPVLYPVYDIDADVSEVAAASVISRVGADEHDAQELASGPVLLNGDRLSLTSIMVGLDNFADFIEEDEDDAEEDRAGSMTRYSSDLDFRGGSVTSRQLVGLHFRGSDVPKGAVITEAYITFTAYGGGNSIDVPFVIYGEPDDSSDGSIAFDGDRYEISSRDNTTASVDWTLSGGFSDGEKVSTPDLKAVVQEIVDHANWNPGTSEDDMTFILKPFGASTGQRELVSRDGADSVGERPQLYIEYYMGTAPVGEETTTGLLFERLDIPRGVTIKDAYIEFTAAKSSSGSYNFSIVAEDEGTPAAYAAVDNNITSGRTPTSGSITWSGDDPVVSGQTFRTPSIASLVETVAARSDWCGGNDMAFMVTGTEGLRNAWSHDGDPSLAPRLVVSYDYSSIPDGTSCYRATTSHTVNSGSDDVEERGSNVSLTGNVLNMESGNNIGIRFAGVAVPNGSKILNAYIELTATEDDTGNTSMTVEVDNSSDADTFTGANNTLDGRTFLSPKVTWNITNDWDDRSVYATPDLKDMVETIVGGGSWASGNGMAFRIITTGSRDRRAYTFNSSPGQAARLVIEYAADGSGSTTRKVRDELISVVDNLSHNGWTPVQDTLYEASQYYTGGDVLYGAKRGGPNDSGPHTYTRVSHAASMETGTYKINYPSGCSEDNLADSDCRTQTISGVGGNAKYVSPINNYCQKTNHIILLTDGYANKDHSATEIKDFIDKSSCADTGTGDGGVCVQDLAKHMREEDMSSLKQTQNIITHTIGFNFASDWLKEVANQGGGEFILANNSKDLVDSISDLIVDMLKVDNTFVAPVAAVNQFNRLNHLDDIYFAVFRPDEYPRWPGNVKKYDLGTDNEVIDKTGALAVDPGTGFFKSDSVDLWDAGSDVYDPNDAGSPVEKGGAGSQSTSHGARKVYTYHENSTSKNLYDSTNRLHVDEIGTSGLTKAMFNATALSDADFNTLIEWVRGKDTDATGDETRYYFGDPLHSRPVAVTYNVSETDPDVEIFVGSNAGSVQSINGKTGIETFAFFPQATLPMQARLKENKSTWPHGYGIDGNIVPWVRDNGANGIDISDTKDFVRLFFGMRRGGYNYYSLDVTNRDRPKIDWIVEGGSADFSEMGQTWGTPIAGRIKLKDEDDPRDVLFISGGYDPLKDEYTTRIEDTVGRAIYIIDALTGERIWSGSPAASGDGTHGYNKQFVDMKYSIPSTLTVADVNSDGLDDVIVVGDTGGQLWRFDMTIGAEPKDLVNGAVIADLGVASGANTEINNRRFFHAPDIAMTERGGKRELAITIGSGFRPSPLSNVTHDRFFMIRQTAVFGPPASYAKITVSDLYDATDNRVGDGVKADSSAAVIADEEADLNAKKGWYINLHDATTPGEKVLSTPLTFRDKIVFITYTPNPGIFDCEAQAGSSDVYFMNLGDATPVKKFGDDGDDCVGADCSEDDRVYRLDTPSIIDEPVFICTGEGCDVFTGAEKPPIPRLTGDRIIKSYWRKDN